jgi:hypothetical protein
MTLTYSSGDLDTFVEMMIFLNDLHYSMQSNTDNINDLRDKVSTDTSGIDTIQSHQNDAPKMTLIIHHQFSGVELVSPVYWSLFAPCYLSPDQNVDVGSTVQVGFNIDSTQEWSLGALMYKLQRKNFDQSNENIVFSENEATCTQLVIICKANSSRELLVCSFLIEHDEGHVWDGAKLMKLTFKCELVNMQHGPIEEIWLIRNNTVLVASLNVACEGEFYKLEMTITEGSVNEDTRRPWYIDVDR